MYRCAFCGAEIPEDARFCGICGRTPISAPEGQTRISGFRRAELEQVPANTAMPGNSSAPAMSPMWEYDQSRGNDDTPTLPLIEDDEERRRRAAMLGMGVMLGADAIPGSSVPMVQGTPQIGSVPFISNAPPLQGGLAGGHMAPGWNAGPANYIPQAPGYTPSMPTGSFPTHTVQQPPQQQPHPKPPKPTPKGGCAPLLIVAILIPLVILGSITTLAFTAFAPNLSLNGSSSVASGGILALHGEHFFPGSSITLTLDNTTPLFVEAHPAGLQTARALSMTVAQVLQPAANNAINADSNGAFSINITIDPTWSTGQHSISASEAITHRSAQLTFTIVSGGATPTPSPTGTGTPAGTVTPTVTPSPTLTPPATATTAALSCINPSSVTLGPVSANYTQAVSTSVALCTTGTGSVNWTANWNASWLALDQSSGTIAAPAQAPIKVIANAAKLAAGNYSTTITFSSQSSNVTESLTVNFTVQTGCINGSPNALKFSAVLHVSEAPSQTVALSNCGATGNWSASVKTSDGASWLSVSPTGGALGANAPLTATISASTLNSTLVAGIYTGTVTFTLGSGTFSVNVTFNVSEAAILSVTPTSLTANNSPCYFSPTAGYYICYVTVTNTSQTSGLNWTSSTNPSGIILKPANGTLGPGQQQPRVLIEIPANDCSNGATITFSGPGNSVTVSWVCQVIG
ncbi:MAG: BACON domain-containing protein [Ktedonobacteraceae bacterium]